VNVNASRGQSFPQLNGAKKHPQARACGYQCCRCRCCCFLLPPLLQLLLLLLPPPLPPPPPLLVVLLVVE
jgi:hypothetical protein